MNSMVPGLFLRDNELTYQQVAELLVFVKQQPETKWVHADNIHPERGVGTTAANYDMLYDRVMTDTQREYLRSLAPKFDDAVLQTQVINRYKVGGYLCDHTDRQTAKYNTIIPLQTSHSQGLRYYLEKNGQLEEHLLLDVAGRMTGVTDPFLVHGIAPVTEERYVFINIYLGKGEEDWNPFLDMYQH